MGNDRYGRFAFFGAEVYFPPRFLRVTTHGGVGRPAATTLGYYVNNLSFVAR